VWRRVWLAEAAALNIKSLGRVMHYERMRALAGGVHTCAISTDYLHELLRTCATFRANRYASRVEKLLHKSNDQLARLLIMAKIVCENHAGLCARCRLPPPPPAPDVHRSPIFSVRGSLDIWLLRQLVAVGGWVHACAVHLTGSRSRSTVPNSSVQGHWWAQLFWESTTWARRTRGGSTVTSKSTSLKP
jgi:hypothetical protein